MPRRSAFGRLLDHFHTHPQGRLHEFLFWAGSGVAVGLLTWLAYWRGWLGTPLALIASIIALCLFGWAFLPQKKKAPPPKTPGRRRAEIAEQVRAMKKERRKGPRPPLR